MPLNISKKSSQEHLVGVEVVPIDIPEANKSRHLWPGLLIWPTTVMTPTLTSSTVTTLHRTTQVMSSLASQFLKDTDTSTSPMSWWDPRLGTWKDRHCMGKSSNCMWKHIMKSQSCCELLEMWARTFWTGWDCTRLSGRLINPKPPKTPPQQNVCGGRDSDLLLVSEPMRIRGTRLILKTITFPSCSLASLPRVMYYPHTTIGGMSIRSTVLRTASIKYVATRVFSKLFLLISTQLIRFSTAITL